MLAKIANERKTMKLINRRKAGKFIALQVIVLLAAVITQMGIQFASSYHWVGFEKKQGSWYTIAMAAQGDKSACQIELDQLHASIQKQNEEGTKDVK